MTCRATALAAVALAVTTLSAKENGSSSVRELPGGVIERCEKLNARNYPQITLFLRKPPGVDKPRGVLCLCLLGNNPEEIGEKICKGRGGWYAFAEERGLAILGWGSRRLWDPNPNCQRHEPGQSTNRLTRRQTAGAMPSAGLPSTTGFRNRAF